MTRDGRADQIVNKKRDQSQVAVLPELQPYGSYNHDAEPCHATCTHMPHGAGFPDPRNFGQVDLGFRAKFGASMLLHHLSRRWILGGEGSAFLAARVEAGCKN